MTSNFFNVIKSLTDELDNLVMLVPERLIAEIMELIASFQLGFES